ncbi:integral membrane protein [Streptomyces viridochromogenes DSM 40736]|uniref:Integral membrane protein n=1 Tax=Streptomyces viridochromogenes (strain DSM 40736 / JCM 4977 / BCRC 1201 / Tue 494) TaxID=591159 RepID=D9WX79_STRVT|nr:integral membrane protein [Streptomyces viridochromogenes DSM 40736]
MTHLPPPAEELLLLDAELRQLEARRTQLLARRAWLVAALHQPQPQPQPGPQGPPTAPPRPETAAPSVQNVLLVLGGVLLTLAAAVFTLVSWGHLGITGRALVLGAVTLAALAAPVLSLKRGLRSTAESVAGLGLALTLLDAYALHAAALSGTDGTGYAAVASAVLAAGWSAYGLLPATAALRLPLPCALAAAQFPLLLWALAGDSGPYVITAALLVTAGLDAAVALRVTNGSVRITALVGAYAMGGSGVLAAGWLSLAAGGPGAASRAGALLLFAAGIALTAAWQTPGEKHPLGLTITSGLLAVAALGAVARSWLPGAWTVPAHLVFGIALLAAVRAGRLPAPVRAGFAWACGAVQALAVLWTLPVVAVAVLGPAGWLGRVWSGAPVDARAAVTVEVPWPPDVAGVPVVLVAVAAVLALAVRAPTWRARARIGALGLVSATALILPAVLEIPYVAGMLVPGGLTAAALYVCRATVSDVRRLAALVLALVASVSLALTSLASQSATPRHAVGAGRGCSRRRRGGRAFAAVTAPAALVYAAALAAATGAAADWPPARVALLVLAVPAAAALLAARLGESRATVPVEVTGAAAGLLAVGLAVTDPPMLALVLALCGVIAAGTAVRPGRRPVGYAATALFVLAAWVRLAAWDVGTPEAYTLPVTLPALLVGVARRRHDPRASSWTAYGPGLAATLVPSLVAAWADPNWTRPLLLGTAALLVTLLGARHHLQAPLVLGGSVLALVTLHELAPYVVQVTGALPRWAPPALAGLLLLALGATYEQRIRDVRRVREVLGRMN